MRSIQRMMNLVEKGGRMLPFGKLRHAGNNLQAIRTCFPSLERLFKEMAAREKW